MQSKLQNTKAYSSNISGYDSHLFIKKLRDEEDADETISCMPCNEEKFISFSKEIVVDRLINKEGQEKLVKKNCVLSNQIKIKSLIMYKDMSFTVHKSHIAWHIATSLNKIIVRVEKHTYKTITSNQCMNKINLQIKTVSTLTPTQDYTITQS